ncbi:hypothetical protein Patl1_15833 [Pistacia atlantica]|uniref:Uncharacterized protein n=1 Tax=Pistacia atlantica TaxID=434234 RepID=A0ACC1B6B4_9ROSI|nr:hypothetical protein Patl1_15833 [Pistacia atlantica]
MLRSGLITPYRGERYHIKEYSQQNPPKNACELFNHQHSSLRNAIESMWCTQETFPHYWKWD